MFKLYKAWAFYLWGIVLMSSFYAIAQQSGEDQQTYKVYFSFHSKTIKEGSINLELKNNEVDLSPAIELIDQLRKSDYAFDLQQMEWIIIDELIDPNTAFDQLCEQSSSKESCIKKAKDSVESAFNKVVKEKENQLLYPEDYSPIYGRSRILNDRMIQKVNEILDSDCPDQMDKNRLSNYITQLHPNRWHELQDKLKYKDKNFLSEIIGKVYDNLKKEKYPNQCFDPANKNHRICKRMKKELAIKTQRFRYLTELIYGQDILKTTEAKAPCLDCVEGSLTQELSDLNHLFSVLQEQSLCFNPPLGGEKQVTNNRYSYTVRREPDGSFLIPLNLAFLADEDYDGDIPRDEVPAHYKNKVQECLKKANSKMLGPNGEQLKMVIQSPPAGSACEATKPKTIKVGPRDFRSYMSKYESNIDCPTITHEILHLLGLCDEYKETSSGFYVSPDTGEIKESSVYEKPDNENDKFIFAYDCRVASKNSIMSDQYERWDNVFKDQAQESKNKSLLSPGQFNSILYGGCPSKNKLFNECADLAYKTSVEEGNENCLKQKRKCIENNVMGYNKAKELSRIKEEIKHHEWKKATNNRYLSEEKEKKNPQTELVSSYKNEVQWADSKLQELREELKIVSAWPD